MSFKSYYNRTSTIRIEIVCAEKRWRPNILSCLKSDWSRILKANTWKWNFLSGLYGLNLLLSLIGEGVSSSFSVNVKWRPISFRYYGRWQTTRGNTGFEGRDYFILFCILQINISHNHFINISILAACSLTFISFSLLWYFSGHI